MRLYTFINCYLSSIQQGIQSAHILGEIAYKAKPQHVKMVTEYLSKHKTIIVCNGGNSKDIWELINFFKDVRNPYPYEYFCEDGDSLEGTLTGVGIILPEEIYNVTSYDTIMFSKPQKVYQYKHESGVITNYMEDGGTNYNYQLIEKIKSYRLAH